MVMRVHELLDHWAQRFPHEIYISDDRRSLTWDEMRQWAHRIGNSLATELRPGDRFCVLDRNSLEMVALYFGAARAGVSRHNQRMERNLAVSVMTQQIVLPVLSSSMALGFVARQLGAHELRPTIIAGPTWADHLARGWTASAQQSACCSVCNRSAPR